MTDLVVKVQLKTTDDGVIANLKLGKKETQAFEQAMRSANREAKSGVKTAKQYAGANQSASERVKKLTNDNHSLSRSYRSVNDGVGRVKSAYATLIGLFASNQVIRTASELEQIDIRLKRLSGSTFEYASNQRFLSETSRELNKDYVTLLDSYARILSLQKAGIVTQKEGRQLLLGLTNASAALGATNTQLAQSLFGMTQGFTSGTLRAEELNQVTEPLPGLLQELDKAAGLASGGFRKMVNDGEVTSAFFKETLIVALESYAGAAKDTANSISGSTTDIRNAYAETVSKLQEPIKVGLQPLFATIADGIRLIPKFKDELALLLKVVTAFVIVKAVTASVRALGIAMGFTATRTALWSRHMTIARARTIALAGGVRALRTAMSFLGGPIGIVAGLLLTAGASALDFAGDANLATKSVTNLTSEMDSLAARHERYKQLIFDRSYQTGVKQTADEMAASIKHAEGQVRRWARRVAAAQKKFDEGLITAEALKRTQESLERITQKLNGLKKVKSETFSDPKADEGTRKFLDSLKEQLATVGKNSDEMLRYKAQLTASSTANSEIANNIKQTANAIIQKRNALKSVKEFEDNEKFLQSIRQEIELVKLGNKERFVEVQLRKLSAGATDEQTQEVIKLAEELYKLQNADNVQKILESSSKETRDLQVQARVSGLENDALRPLQDYHAQRSLEIERQYDVERFMAVEEHYKGVEERRALFEERLIEMGENQEAVMQLKE